MRLIDLHVDWLLQYAGETVVFDPGRYPGVTGRLGQLEGYLQTTRAAVFSCFRGGDDWANQVDPWAALGQLIARIEAEFPGRLLISPDDLERFQDDRNGLCWGMIGVEGFDALIRSKDDLTRLPGLFGRGVRVFQPVYTATSLLGGSSEPGDDRGLTDLGRNFLETLDGFVSVNPVGRPLVDLAHMNPLTMSGVLDWYDLDTSRAQRVLPVYSHGSPAHPTFGMPRAITLDNLRRLRALGGYVGLGVTPPFFQTPGEIEAVVELIASFPFHGREGFEGIAIGTDFMGVVRTLPGLGNAAEVVALVLAHFDRATAKALVHDNALTLLAHASGARRLAR